MQFETLRCPSTLSLSGWLAKRLAGWLAAAAWAGQDFAGSLGLTHSTLESVGGSHVSATALVATSNCFTYSRRYAKLEVLL